jgi:hypothetical protein
MKSTNWGWIMRRWFALLLTAVSCVTFAGPWAVAAELDAALEKLRAVGPKGAGHEQAQAAWKTVAATPAREVTSVLAAMDGANPLAENWLRAAVETIAGREREQLPVKQLEQFLADTSHAPRSRRLAYELIASVDSGAQTRLIPGFLNDPSLELRHDAVAMLINDAEKALGSNDKPLAIERYQKAFDASRDLDQIKQTADKLKMLGEKPDLAGHFGWINRWYLIAPFDNKDTRGFDVAYPPEQQPFKANATYDGVGGEVKWIEASTADDYGVVDLNKHLGKHKGAIAYAYAEFDSEQDQTVDARLGSINGNKLWINGQLIFANHVYHANQAVDQYVGQAKLKKGRNTILLKIAQNEQTESWAQDWQFQFRLCDRVGTPVK